jgi:hypothetical protein
MMNTVQLHQAIDKLPDHLQKEIADYVAFLWFKYRTGFRSIDVPANSPIDRLPLQFGAAKGRIRYLSDDWEADLDSEFDLFHEPVQ